MNNSDNNKVIKYYSNDKYTIYSAYTIDGEEYYIVLPYNENRFDICIDFKEEYYNSLFKNEIIEQIKDRYEKIYKINPNAIYILPNVSTYEYNMALADNDNQAYEHIFNRLKLFVSHAYHLIKKDYNDINSIVNIITENNDDKKFMHWLEITNGDYFKELDINKVLDNPINDNDDGSNPTRSGNSGSEISNTNTVNKTKLLVPKLPKHGFSNITFIITILILAMIIGIFLGMIIYFKKI